MNGCSLDDAFGSPGCAGNYGGKEARKEERKKAKRCKGPPLAFLGLKDPDRQHLDKAPIVPAMNPLTGLREHVPVDAPDGSEEPFADVPRSFEDAVAEQRKYEFGPRTDDDPEGDKARDTLPSPALISVMGSGDAGNGKGGKKSFFGADPADSFADYHPDAKNYLMEPNFTAAFDQGLTPGSRAGAATLPVPSVRDVWKPMIPSGAANTAFFEKLPPTGGQYPKADGQSYESLSRKIDKVMARLEDIQRGNTPEQAQTDILLFVSSGIFVLFLMDLAVRKGGSMRFF